MVKVSSKCISLVKKFEGLYTKAYRDPVGIWTIGYGITNADYSITKVKIKAGLVISAKTADNWLEKSLNKKYLPKVMKYDDKYEWTQNEIDALVSFCYNIGNIDTLTDNGSRTKAQIAEKILAYNKAGGKVYRGLTRRRKAEHDLFINKTYAVVSTKTDPLTMRKAAATSSTSIAKISKGTKVEVIKKGTSWTKIKYKSKKGYVATKYLKF